MPRAEIQEHKQQTTNKTKDRYIYIYITWVCIGIELINWLWDVYVNLDNGIGSEQGMHINNSLTTNCNEKFFMKAKCIIFFDDSSWIDKKQYSTFKLSLLCHQNRAYCYEIIQFKIIALLYVLELP